MPARCIRGFAVLALAAALAACGKPVPPDKAAYVGEWKQPAMYLLITQDGSVRYERIQGGVTTSINGPLQGFAGDNFDVGLGPLKSTFVVTRPPREANGRWTMVVDGVELMRSADLQTTAR